MVGYALKLCSVDMLHTKVGSYTAVSKCLYTNIIVAMLLVAGCWFLMPASAVADSSQQVNQRESMGTLTDTITDPQNLLGSNVGVITDAIQDTEKTTGIHVRLLYVPTFSKENNPDKWVSQVLESSQPASNTVLLAVASSDGNLVVAVSANSQQWLRKQSTVDSFSQAALSPIADSNSPNWVGSAQALLDSVREEKRHHDQQILIRNCAIALGVIVVIAGAMLWYWLKRKKRFKHGHR